MNVNQRTPTPGGAPLFASAWLALFFMLRGMLVRQS